MIIPTVEKQLKKANVIQLFLKMKPVNVFLILVNAKLKKKMCSDFNIANYITKCSEMSEKFVYKKCIYSNSICQDVNRTCSEITSRTTDDICENAKVSEPNNKRCIIGKYYGCKEIDKVIYSDKSSRNIGLFYKLSMYKLLFKIFVLIL